MAYIDANQLEDLKERERQALQIHDEAYLVNK